MASVWTRETPWKQGSALTESASLSLALVEPELKNTHIAIVVSHDCDIAEDNLDNEPSVEIIIGKLVDEADPNLTHAKSPNRLHLEIIQQDEAKFIELLATQKRHVSKDSLTALKPDSRIALSSQSREILQAWLASRYRRAAFPDALNAHLILLRETLQKIGKKNPKAVIGFYIYFEPDSEVTDPSEPYEVWLVIVFDHLIDGAEEFAMEASRKIVARMEAKFRTNVGWHGVELRSCDTCSDEEFSLYSAMTFKSYPLEYLSLRSS